MVMKKPNDKILLNFLTIHLLSKYVFKFHQASLFAIYIDPEYFLFSTFPGSTLLFDQ